MAKQIIEITNDPKQKFVLITEDKEEIDFSIEYSDTQQVWTYNLIYQNFTINGAKIVNNPNLLRKFKNLLPFGISCIIADGSDPYFIDDFSNGRAELFLLNEEDVEAIETELYE